MKSFVTVLTAVLLMGAAIPAQADDAKNAACDAVAASPRDTTKPAGVEGVSFGDVDSAKARPICEAAAAADPTNVRIVYQAGRSIDAGGKDLRAALVYYEKAASMGHVLANYSVGNIFWNDQDGIPRDSTIAAKYFTVAANGGLDLSMEILGRLYEMGKGVPQDYAQAKMWFDKGSALGEADSMDDLGRLYDRGKGIPVDKNLATAWFKKSADAGSSEGMSDYGISLQFGQGVTKNLSEAARYYRMGADGGSGYGKINLARTMFDGDLMPKDQAGGYAIFVEAVRDSRNGLYRDIVEERAEHFVSEVQIKSIEAMLKWKGLFNGTPDESFDDESYAAITKIHDTKM